MCRERLSKELKNLILLFAGIMVIVCIISFPIIYFRSGDASHYNIEHSMNKITFELDTDVENVWMVKELHRILESPYQFQNIEAAALLQVEDIVLKAEYDDVNVITEIKGEEVLTLSQDEATGKVIQVQYKQKNYNRKKYIKKLCTEEGDKQLRQELIKFLTYLGLDIIDDWIYTSVLQYYDNYDEAKREGADFEWYISSDSAKLALYAKPEKNGVKYYFQMMN